MSWCHEKSGRRAFEAGSAGTKAFLLSLFLGLAVLLAAPDKILTEGDEPMIREAVVAGQFYPSRSSDLDSFMTSVFKKDDKKEEALAIVVPHAGYIYSGKVAAAAFSRVSIPDNVVLLGPNHTGRGALFSVFEKGAWITPYGKVPVNDEFTGALLAATSLGKSDVNAHLFEHSLEVQVPFLQYARKDGFKIVPIAIADHKKENLKSFGIALAETIKKSGGKTLIVASSDFSHYEQAKTAREKDYLCFAAIQALDADKLLDEVTGKDISMCGYLPVYVAITAAKELGATRGELITYANSGDVTGDQTEVVGYGALVIK
jgi:hypothetical protein